jgi:hypothetical protein
MWRVAITLQLDLRLPANGTLRSVEVAESMQLPFRRDIPSRPRRKGLIELCSIRGDPLPLIFAMGVPDKTCAFV